MKYYDVSMKISADMQVYKNKEEKKPVFRVASDFDTSVAHETEVTLHLHTGTHMDFPLHMIKDGQTSSELILDRLIREVKVFDLSNVKESISKEDLIHLDINKDDFILFKTRNSQEEDLNFNFIYIDQSAALYLNQKQINQFKTYYETLIEYNKKVNLTRITKEDEVYYKHFYDSLTLMKTFSELKDQAICDMGAGAGFPSIPLKIIFPKLKVTIIDSLGKRITFLEKLLEALCINDVELIYDRIENYAIKHQKAYDIVTARALGSLHLIVELGLPMVKVGQQFIAYKGSNYKQEINEANHALNTLGGKVEKTIEINLPNDMGSRALVNIIKEKHVFGYPRAFATIKKKPL